MKPEDLVPTLPTCIALKEAGWDVPTCFYWEQWEDDGLDPAGPTPEPEFYVCPADFSLEEAQIAPAPTLGEILEQLRKYTTLIHLDVFDGGCTIRDGKQMFGPEGFADGYKGSGDFAEAAAQLWIRV